MDNLKNKIWGLLSKYNIYGENLGLKLESSSEFLELLCLAYSEIDKEREETRRKLESKFKINEEQLEVLHEDVNDIICDEINFIFDEIDNETSNSNNIKTENNLISTAYSIYYQFKLLLTEELKIELEKDLTFYNEKIKLAELDVKMNKIKKIEIESRPVEMAKIEKLLRETEYFKENHPYFINKINDWRSQFEESYKQYAEESSLFTPIFNAEKTKLEQKDNLDKQNRIIDDIIK